MDRLPTLAEFLRSAFRRSLAYRGYSICRTVHGVAPSAPEYIRSIAQLGKSLNQIICFDNDYQIHEQLENILANGSSRFVHAVLDDDEARTKDHVPSVPFLVEFDGDAFPLHELLKVEPWIVGAKAILIRSRMGSYLSGMLNLRSLMTLLEQHEFALAEVLDFTPPTSPLQATTQQVILAFESGRLRQVRRADIARRYRVNEALAALELPIARLEHHKLLAGRGSFGSSCGLFNPGAVTRGDQIELLARVESTSWGVQKARPEAYFAMPEPLHLGVTQNGRLRNLGSMRIQGRAPGLRMRFEDFRLFKHANRLYSNHSVTDVAPPFEKSRSAMHHLRTRVGISVVDFNANTIDLLGLPSIDRRPRAIEKNWAFFSEMESVCFIYTFQPYHIMAATAWPGVEFRSTIQQSIVLQIGEDGLSIRNSINPISYDNAYWLHVIHKVYPHKRYVYWAVLIDKQSLLPSKITRRPLVCAPASSSASTIYLCSAVAYDSEVHFFAGLEDSSIATWRLSRAVLDREWSLL